MKSRYKTPSIIMLIAAISGCSKPIKDVSELYGCYPDSSGKALLYIANNSVYSSNKAFRSKIVHIITISSSSSRIEFDRGITFRHSKEKDTYLENGDDIYFMMASSQDNVPYLLTGDTKYNKLPKGHCT